MTEQQEVMAKEQEKLDPDQAANLQQGTIPRGGETREGAPNLAEAGDDELYTTVNPMQMDREPTFRLDEHQQGAQHQPQPTTLPGDLAYLSDRRLTDDEQARLDDLKK